MGFFRDPESRSRGFGIGIFYFGLDRKIPKENPEKIPKEKSRKSQNPGDRDRDFETSKKSRKNPECEIPKIPKSRGSGLGFENPEEIPRKSRKNPEKNPEKIPNEKSRKSQNPGDRDLFFRDIPGKSRSGGVKELKDPT